MRSLKIEQIAVIKFLTLEGSDKSEIFNRLKSVFNSYTLPKSKVFKLHYRFVNEGLLGPQKFDLGGIDENFEVSSSANVYNEEATDQNDHISSIYCSDYAEPLQYNLISDMHAKSNILDANCDSDKLYHKLENINSLSQRTKRKASVKASQVWRKALTIIKEDPDSETPVFMQVLQDDEDRNETNSCLSEDFSRKQEEQQQSLSESSVSILPHPSIFRSENEALVSIAPKQLTCQLCPDKKFDVPFSLKRHFRCLHLNHKISVGPFVCLICRCGCNESGFLRSHYHCPLCLYPTQKTRVVQHYKQHFVSESNLEEIKMVVEKRKICICIDSSTGLYLVPKTDNEPIHIIKYIENGQMAAKCSQSLCQTAMAKARDNGVNDLNCKHILRATEKTIEYIDNNSIFLAILNSDDVHIGREERELCFYLIEEAFKRQTSPLVEWTPQHQKYVSFFSVFCDSSYSVFGRLIVKYDANNNVFYCHCPLSEKNSFCPYEKLCELYLRFSRTLQ